MLEELLVGSVHLRKVVHGSQEHIDLNNLLNTASSFLKNSRQVLDAELGHGRDAGGLKGENFAFGCAWDFCMGRVN